MIIADTLPCSESGSRSGAGSGRCAIAQREFWVVGWVGDLGVVPGWHPVEYLLR